MYRVDWYDRTNRNIIRFYWKGEVPGLVLLIFNSVSRTDKMKKVKVAHR